MATIAIDRAFGSTSYSLVILRKMRRAPPPVILKYRFRNIQPRRFLNRSVYYNYHYWERAVDNAVELGWPSSLTQ